uniref:Uncharacterized protein n=1 Tax=Tetradesmus obliquus TaxID=3088 RepID=A0A383VN96_TETOB|eukprot:jgi/Sobl393_1/17188/SZX66641.1
MCPKRGCEDHLPQAKDAAPAAKRTRKASSSAAAAAEASAAEASAAAFGVQELARFPARNFVFDESEYFMRQQAACWQPHPQPPTTPNTTARTGSSSSRSRNSKRSSSSRANDTGSERPKVYLTIESAEQLPAAKAVIAAMYEKPEAISSL